MPFGKKNVVVLRKIDHTHNNYNYYNNCDATIIIKTVAVPKLENELLK